MKKIYIDGENFVHIIVHALLEQELIKSRDDLKYFDFRKFVQIINRQQNKGSDEIFYYAARLKVIKINPEILEKTKKMIKWNDTWINQIIAQGVGYVKHGQIKVRDSEVCPKCGHSQAILQEKGVDVGMAVDIVSDSLRKTITECFVVSGDSDLVPAVRRAHGAGVRVVYVGYSKWFNKSLSSVADEVRTFTPEDLASCFGKVRGEK